MCFNGGKVAQIGVRQRHLAISYETGCLQKPNDSGSDCGFSRTTFANKAVNFSGRNGHSDVFDRCNVTKA
jgi:hypothetical protein